MFTLFHHAFCPHSRFVRLILGEYGFDVRLVEERVWERREAFLALNPAGTTPVLFAEGMPAIPSGGIIAEFIDEAYGGEMEQKRLMPVAMGERIEVRRLMAWFNEKFFEEASGPLVTERVYKRFMNEKDGGGAPSTDVIRAAKNNVRYHLSYIGWLARTRNFLAGDRPFLWGQTTGLVIGLLSLAAALAFVQRLFWRPVPCGQAQTSAALSTPAPEESADSGGSMRTRAFRFFSILLALELAYVLVTTQILFDRHLLL